MAIPPADDEEAPGLFETTFRGIRVERHSGPSARISRHRLALIHARTGNFNVAPNYLQSKILISPFDRHEWTMVACLLKMNRAHVEERKGTVYEDIPHYNKKTRKKKRPRLMAVVNDACTGCEACIPFCPVDCIDHEPPAGYTGAVIPPVRIRWHECIGCQICARVCEGMAWNAIDMISIDQFEADFEMRVGDQLHPPGEVPQEAVGAAISD